MTKYSQGICSDGAAILMDGEQMTVEQILGRLSSLEHELGLARIMLDHKTTLLDSCEQALRKRDAKQ